MKQRIIIKNFGPIKDVDLEINDFMVFIGPQASGKSTIAKLVYFFRNIDEFFIETLIKDFTFGALENSHIKGALARTFLSMYNFPPLISYANPDTCIIYKFIPGREIRLMFRLGGPELPFLVEGSNEFTHLYAQISELYMFYDSSIERKENFELSRDFKEIQGRLREDLNRLIKPFMSKNSSEKQLFIPDNRHDFIKGSFAYKSSDTAKFHISEEFDKEVDDIRFYFSMANLKRILLKDNIAKLSKKVLKGKYFYNSNGKDVIAIENKQIIRFIDASSGQKEAVWIVQYIQKALIEKSNAFTIIEEPEAHLFPAAQKSLTELIALLANSAENQVMLTTHSPYILAAINNLMQAYKAGQSHPEKTDEIINKELWLDPKRVSAYFVGGEGNEGKIKDIIDDDLDFIKVEEIDSISSVFNSDFDKLTDLEYNVVS